MKPATHPFEPQLRTTCLTLCLTAAVSVSATAAAEPYWGAFQADQCTSLSTRQYSAVLWDIPIGASWEATCAATPATINDYYFSAPARCVNTGLNMWGEFDVPDPACTPVWGDLSDSGCVGLGTRKYSAILWNIPPGFSWEDTCAQTSATVADQYFATPTRCVNTGLNIWGEWEVSDASCYPTWGSFQKDDCRDSGKRQYAAILWDIPWGASWEGACAQTPATLDGTFFAHPTRCVNDTFNMWGEFEVEDPTCNPVTECTDPGVPIGAFAKTGNNGTVSCDAYCANRDFNWGPAGSCVKGVLDTGPNAGACIRCVDVANDLGAVAVTCYCQPPLYGFADLHNHQFANEGFGGLAFQGKAFGPIDQALPHCDAAHGPGGLGDGLATLLGSLFVYWNQGPGHLVGGYPEFDGWPRWNSSTHQSVYEDWLRRAYLGGLRLMVVLAVNNEDIFNAPLWAAKAPGRTGSDSEAIELQLDQAYAMQAHIDETAGGAGLGWYRIVTSAGEARQVIEAGKLAVVLGTEVDNLFNCRDQAGCTPAYVSQELQHLYDRGVRHVFPIHFKTNGFGGAALQHALTTGPERDCSAEGYEHACNALGMTELGKYFIGELMKRQMMIDIDHMSRLSFEDTLAIAEANHYPVVSGHTGFIDIAEGEKRHEGNLMPQQVERIRALGGMLAAIVNQGRLHDIDTWRGAGQPVVQHFCGGTSQTWAQAYLYAVNKMAGGPVAFGTDFNGLAGLPGPRHSPGGLPTELIEACPGSAIVEKPRQTAWVRYPFAVAVAGSSGGLDRSVVGSRTFDVNVDGLAHVGLLPDFIEDLKQQGIRPQDLAPLFNSAEGYVKMWERAEAAMVTDPVFPDGGANPAGNAGDANGEGQRGCQSCEAASAGPAVLVVVLLGLGPRRRRNGTRI